MIQVYWRIVATSFNAVRERREQLDQEYKALMRLERAMLDQEFKDRLRVYLNSIYWDVTETFENIKKIARLFAWRLQEWRNS